MAAPTTRRAIQLIAPGNIQIQSDVPAPRLRPDYVIAEAKAWALNPTDIGHIDRLGGPGTIIGCDWSGVVTAVGENVTRFKPGDAVSGVCHGGNITEPEDGAYANIVVSKELATMHKPENLSFAEAVSLGVGMATIGQAMYWIMKMRLPSPDGTPEPIAGPAVFVYGGSSATGSLAIQAAKRSGYKVYTACSPSNFDLVKSRGADAWFDYNQTTCADDILAAVTKESSSSIGYIIDCIGNDASGTLCASILSPAGGHYHSIKPPVPETFKTLRSEETVTATTGLGYAMAGESFELPPGTIHPADLEQGEFAKEWAVLGEKLLAAGKIRPHPVSVREGGLEAVVAAIEEVRGSGPRGVKIVCTA